jgi:hypothetical protein
MAFRLAEWYVQFSQRGLSGVARDADKAEKELKETGTAADKLKGRLSDLISPTRMLGAALASLGVGMGLRESLRLFARDEDAMTRLAAVVRATGGAAGFTADELATMAADLQKVTRFGDEATMEAQAMLLTFREIKREGGVFEDVLELAMDIASAFKNISLESATMQLGKAFEDPARQMSYLRRSGISFSKQQEDSIKSLQEQGRMAEAQMVMIGVIQAQLGGTARAMAKETVGRWQQVTNEMGDSLETIGKGIATTVGDIVLPLFKGLAQTVGFVGKLMESRAVRVFMKFTAILVGAGGTAWALLKIIGLVKALVVTIQGLVTAQTILQALSGPAGWAAIAAGAAVAVAGVAALSHEFGRLKQEANEALDAAGKPVRVPGVPGEAGAAPQGQGPPARILERAAAFKPEELRMLGTTFDEMLWDLAREVARKEVGQRAVRLPGGKDVESYGEAMAYMRERPKEFRPEDIAEVQAEATRAGTEYARQLFDAALALQQQTKTAGQITRGLGWLGTRFRPLGDVMQGMRTRFEEGAKAVSKRRQEAGKEITSAIPVILSALAGKLSPALALAAPGAGRAASAAAAGAARGTAPAAAPGRSYSMVGLADLASTMQAEAGRRIQERQLETQQGMLATLKDLVKGPGRKRTIGERLARWGEVALGR